MQELIERLTTQAGISAEQAAKAVEVVKEFVKEKFPMVGGAVDSILGGAEAGGKSGAADDILG